MAPSTLPRRAATVTGVCVARSAEELGEAVCWHAERAAARLEVSTRLTDGDVILLDQYLGPGYGVVTPRLRDTVRTVAQLHGMVLDPVYNAKTALALMDQVQSGAVPRDATVVLFNTGGGPGIYPHSASLHGAGSD